MAITLEHILKFNSITDEEIEQESNSDPALMLRMMLERQMCQEVCKNVVEQLVKDAEEREANSSDISE